MNKFLYVLIYPDGDSNKSEQVLGYKIPDVYTERDIPIDEYESMDDFLKETSWAEGKYHDNNLIGYYGNSKSRIAKITLT